jgi:ADP-ribose pyrophosphatase YjhB (NUDIX family)
MVKKAAMFYEGNVPKGGVCLSAFLVMRGKSGVLLGKMAKPELWVEKFFGEFFAAEGVSSGKWVLPASHLQFFESPDDAATRVLTEEVQAKKTKLRLHQVQSHLAGNPDDPEGAHWDICFVYGGTLKGRSQRPEWFSELKFVNTRNLTKDDFARGHGDILKQLGVIKR